MRFPKLNQTYMAKYECLSCHCKWKGLAGPATCPKCGEKLIKWVNYETLAREYRKSNPLDHVFGS